MISSLQQQYIGFLNTPQLQLFAEDFPYSNFRLTEVLEKLPVDFIMPDSIRLGQRMEMFMQAALSSDRYQISSKNLQIITKKQTLGELDFILNDLVLKKIIHLEMVYKFYFYRPELSGSWIDKLIGPNAKDKLRFKLNKMSSHQFPILYRPETAIYLNNLNLKAEDLIQQISFKAQVYFPFNQKIYDSGISEDQIQGFYFKLEELEFFNKNDFTFYIPNKNDWVSSPIFKTTKTDNFSVFIKKISAVLEEQRSYMFWVFESDSKFKRHFATYW
ncbi:DUF1853 family protein [Leeuwenhoekiella marinoflava]|uniref:DUF1853 family protein n=2 Tax=Leeuwenhoekiella marinoflava TaxID=988 RepID=A0A4Q0PBA9_9FLAO|nr:DUF1853 family protein [Leeuwenhoekiella marinoflava]RXG24100.1 hypothetical protein DSL99_3742 [Leeuwenhoekiella marinoflava]SHF97684.1 hypothetical protein SAMN02745246_03881 [Leeuwenhoekiella marinoflava DSM 3653]